MNIVKLIKKIFNWLFRRKEVSTVGADPADGFFIPEIEVPKEAMKIQERVINEFIKLTPGKRHAWYKKSYGMVRKPLQK